MSERSIAEYVYIAREPECGCVTAALVDLPDRRSDVNAEIGEWIRGGRSVGRVPYDEGATVDSCPHWRWESGERVRARGRLL